MVMKDIQRIYPIRCHQRQHHHHHHQQCMKCSIHQMDYLKANVVFLAYSKLWLSWQIANMLPELMREMFAYVQNREDRHTQIVMAGNM